MKQRTSFSGACREESSHEFPSFTIPNQAESVEQMLTRFNASGQLPKPIPHYYDENPDITMTPGYDLADAKLHEQMIFNKGYRQALDLMRKQKEQSEAKATDSLNNNIKKPVGVPDNSVVVDK